MSTPQGRVTRPRVLRLLAIGAVTFGLTALALPIATSIGHAGGVSDPGLVILGSLGGNLLVIGAVARFLAPWPDGWNAMFAGAIAGGAAYFGLVALSSGEDGFSLLLIPLLGGIAGGWAVATFGSLGFGAADLVVRLVQRPK